MGFPPCPRPTPRLPSRADVPVPDAPSHEICPECGGQVRDLDRFAAHVLACTGAPPESRPEPAGQCNDATLRNARAAYSSRPAKPGPPPSIVLCEGDTRPKRHRNPFGAEAIES